MWWQAITGVLATVIWLVGLHLWKRENGIQDQIESACDESIHSMSDFAVQVSIEDEKGCASLLAVA